MMVAGRLEAKLFLFPWCVLVLFDLGNEVENRLKTVLDTDHILMGDINVG